MTVAALFAVAIGPVCLILGFDTHAGQERQHFLAPLPGINLFIPEYDFCFLPFLFLL